MNEYRSSPITNGAPDNWRSSVFWEHHHTKTGLPVKASKALSNLWMLKTPTDKHSELKNFSPLTALYGMLHITYMRPLSAPENPSLVKVEPFPLLWLKGAKSQQSTNSMVEACDESQLR